MIKHIIKEISPESIDISIMFDDEGLKAASGFNNQLFIIFSEYGRYYGFNADEYKDIVTRIDDFLTDFTERTPGATRKSVMTDYEIKYNSRLCHALTEYAKKTPYVSNIDDVAQFLTLTTGHKWGTSTARGYVQSDYAKMLYCADSYTADSIAAYGDYYFGCCKEFCVIDVDENENEIDSCYGYFVADSDIKSWSDSDNEYKRIVCENAGIDPDETRLELIESSRTVTQYTYRAV